MHTYWVGGSEETRDLSNYTLLLSTHSVGLTGCFAVDALVRALAGPNPSRAAEPSARLDSDHVEAVVGMEPLRGQKALRTALELFVFPDARVAVLIQRVPARRGHVAVFARELAAWARGLGVSRAVVLASADSARATKPEQFNGGTLPDGFARVLLGSDLPKPAHSPREFEPGTFSVLFKPTCFTVQFLQAFGAPSCTVVALLTAAGTGPEAGKLLAFCSLPFLPSVPSLEELSHQLRLVTWEN